MRKRLAGKYRQGHLIFLPPFFRQLPDDPNSTARECLEFSAIGESSQEMTLLPARDFVGIPLPGWQN
jgi:hypothetical protein